VLTGQVIDTRVRQATGYFCVINYVCISHTGTTTQQRSQTAPSADKSPLETWIFAPDLRAVLPCAD